MKYSTLRDGCRKSEASTRDAEAILEMHNVSLRGDFGIRGSGQRVSIPRENCVSELSQ